MIRLGTGCLLLALAAPVSANDWQKNYKQASDISNLQYATAPPQIAQSSGDIEIDRLEMFRKGYALIGYSSFTSSNASVKDALRWAAKIKAHYVVLSTDFNSSTTTSMTLTVPTQTMSSTNGTVNVRGPGGSATGTYMGTSTTYGSKTTSYPITVNWYDKFAAYYAKLLPIGAGIRMRDLTPDEVATYETRRGFVVLAVRDDSPADHANLLPGDAVLKVNGKPCDQATFIAATKENTPLSISLLRKGQPREIELVIPEEWRPAKN